MWWPLYILESLNVSGHRNISIAVYSSVWALWFSGFVFHILFRMVTFQMAPVCPSRYKNSDFTCACHKQHDALEPKVQHSTNKKFYFLFVDRIQARASPGITLRYSVKSWQAYPGFFYLLFYDKPWHWEWFLKTTQFIFINKHGIMWPLHCTNVIVKHPKVHSVIKLPSSTVWASEIHRISSAREGLWLKQTSGRKAGGGENGFEGGEKAYHS